MFVVKCKFGTINGNTFLCLLVQWTEHNLPVTEGPHFYVSLVQVKIDPKEKDEDIWEENNGSVFLRLMNRKKP